MASHPHKKQKCQDTDTEDDETSDVISSSEDEAYANLPQDFIETTDDGSDTDDTIDDSDDADISRRTTTNKLRQRTHRMKNRCEAARERQHLLQDNGVLTSDDDNSVSIATSDDDEYDDDDEHYQSDDNLVDSADEAKFVEIWTSIVQSRTLRQGLGGSMQTLYQDMATEDMIAFLCDNGASDACKLKGILHDGIMRGDALKHDQNKLDVCTEACNLCGRDDKTRYKFELGLRRVSLKARCARRYNALQALFGTLTLHLAEQCHACSCDPAPVWRALLPHLRVCAEALV